MDNEVFIEYLVKKQKTVLDFLVQLGIVVGGIVLIILSFLVTPYLGGLSILSTLAIVAVIYGVYYLVTGVNREYEYILTNGEMDVDRIIAQRKRKRLITTKCKDFESFGRYNPQMQLPQGIQTRHFACSAPDASNVYYFTVHHPVQGYTMVVFNMNEKMAGHMKKYVPRSLRGDLLD